MKYLVFLLVLAGCATNADVVKVLVEDVNGTRQALQQYQQALVQCQQKQQEQSVKKVEKKAEKPAEKKVEKGN